MKEDGFIHIWNYENSVGLYYHVHWDLKGYVMSDLSFYFLVCYIDWNWIFQLIYFPINVFVHRVVCIERLRARRDGWWGNVTLFGFGRSSPFAAIGLLSTTSGQARCCHHVYFLDLPMVYSCIVAPIDNHWSGDELSCHSSRLFANDHTRQPMNWAESFGISGYGWWYILLLEQFLWSQPIEKVYNSCARFDFTL